MWYNLAAEQGDVKAVKERDSLSRKMTSEDIGKAQALAQECFSKN